MDGGAHFEVGGGVGRGADDGGGLCLVRFCGSGGLPAAFVPGEVKTHNHDSKGNTYKEA